MATFTPDKGKLSKGFETGPPAKTAPVKPPKAAAIPPKKTPDELRAALNRYRSDRGQNAVDASMSDEQVRKELERLGALPKS